MELQDFINQTKKSIELKFKCRNVSAASPARMKMIKSQRRFSIKISILRLRLATNPKTQHVIENEIMFGI